ncbi:hypothetical protein [Curtobacterium sp. MR_MD2014]|uniref:hypothetical protein n=1 Tax=Curtobacterium sp. MR_MD2014 TaxID=1561023 RepID=UPI000AB47D2C|nr:hypothetical protein [Curtobacterium sp. MR_MD2014]
MRFVVDRDSDDLDAAVTKCRGQPRLRPQQVLLDLDVDDRDDEPRRLELPASPEELEGVRRELFRLPASKRADVRVRLDEDPPVLGCSVELDTDTVVELDARRRQQHPNVRRDRGDDQRLGVALSEGVGCVRWALGRSVPTGGRRHWSVTARPTVGHIWP